MEALVNNMYTEQIQQNISIQVKNQTEELVNTMYNDQLMHNQIREMIETESYTERYA